MSTSRASERRPRRAAFTLLEVALAFVLLAGMFTLVMSTMAGSSDQLNETLATDQLNHEVTHALHRIAQDLSATERGYVNYSNDQLNLQKTSSWDYTAGQVWDPVEYVYRVRANPDTGRNELVCEHAASPTVLAHHVSAFSVTTDPPSSTPGSLTLLDPNTANVTVSLTLSRQIGVNANGSPRNRTVTSTRTIYVRPNLN
jgi:type II secretory pathway pseudopilin PulG